MEEEIKRRTKFLGIWWKQKITYENMTQIFVCLSNSNVCFETSRKAADGKVKESYV